jgi:hypothetical protein
MSTSDTFEQYDVKQAYISKSPSTSRIFGFCASGGGLFGLLAWAACPEFYQLVGFPGMAFAWFLGLTVGLCCAIVAVPLLNSRDLARAKPIVVWPTGLVILAMFGYWGVPALTAARLPLRRL